MTFYSFACFITQMAMNGPKKYLPDKTQFNVAASRARALLPHPEMCHAIATDQNQFPFDSSLTLLYFASEQITDTRISTNSCLLLLLSFSLG